MVEGGEVDSFELRGEERRGGGWKEIWSRRETKELYSSDGYMGMGVGMGMRVGVEKLRREG